MPDLKQPRESSSQLDNATTPCRLLHAKDVILNVEKQYTSQIAVIQAREATLRFGSLFVLVPMAAYGKLGCGGIQAS
ncbi:MULTISPECIES: hypothetical protein [unclassified Rhizobium]|uniref:hypothetical protein n=1 Tax=unclassified Rhizobium TaxID=2613769 RepID=UPI00104A5403|nr:MULTISPECIES: hypothetical protein [unclassified Rhizobium]MBB3393629.1 hypothetical protein [Rhizobium sp. BK060]MBB4166348.1 hypothetical protein [Rhizobium sp. BK538]